MIFVFVFFLIASLLHSMPIVPRNVDLMNGNMSVLHVCWFLVAVVRTTGSFRASNDVSKAHPFADRFVLQQSRKPFWSRLHSKCWSRCQRYSSKAWDLRFGALDEMVQTFDENAPAAYAAIGGIECFLYVPLALCYLCCACLPLPFLILDVASH